MEFNLETLMVSYGTIIEMLTDRHEDIVISDLSTFIPLGAGLRSDRPITVTATSVISSVGYVVCWSPQSMTIQKIGELKNLMDEKGLNKIILILNSTITPKAVKFAEVKKNIFEIWTFTETQYNVTKNRLVPRHIAIKDEEEKEKIIKSYGSVSDRFPKILTSDPIARWYGWKVGTLIKIIREGTMGPDIYYRIVANS